MGQWNRLLVAIRWDHVNMTTSFNMVLLTTKLAGFKILPMLELVTSAN